MKDNGLRLGAVRQLCQKNKWFTNGDVEQYETMLDMVSENSPLYDIAIVIWICSENVTMNGVKKALEAIACHE